MSIISNKNILRFERAVDDVLLVEVLHANDDFSEDVFDGIFCEFDLLFVNVKVEISFWKVLHYDVDVFVILEGLDDIGEEGVIFD